MTKKREDCPVYSCHSLPLFKFGRNEHNVLCMVFSGHIESCSQFYCPYPEINCGVRLNEKMAEEEKDRSRGSINLLEGAQVLRGVPGRGEGAG